MSSKAKDIDACDACRNGAHEKCSDPDECGCEYVLTVRHSGETIEDLRTRLATAEQKLRDTYEELQRRRYAMLTLDAGEAVIVDLKTWNNLLVTEKMESRWRNLGRMAMENFDDDLENRPLRHAIGKLHAQLHAALEKS